MFDLLESESKCYKYFVDNGIKNREDLRTLLKQEPIPNLSQGFVEFLFSNFQKERKSIKKHKKEGIEKTICISDLHIPYQDDKVVDLVFDCILELQPHNLVLNGDIIDCYWSSTFIKKPRNTSFLQEEADIFYKKFSYLRRHLPKTNIYYILGNHEDRINKSQCRDPQYYELRALNPIELLRLNKLDIQLHKKKLELNGLLYVHGETASKNSSYTAKAEFENHMRSGMSGHTHRLGSYYKSYDGEVKFWFENGCLCKLDPEYIKDVVNWQHGFSIIDNYEGVNQVSNILINDYKFNYNGVLYK